MNDMMFILELFDGYTFGLLHSNSPSLLQRKADEQSNPQEYKDLQEHLITILLGCLGSPKERIDASELTEVQQRLVHCNLERRHRFLYARQHSSSPSQIMESSESELAVGYLRPPTMKEGARDFICPCCYRVLPVAYAEGDVWKMHVADDLRPYTCILPDCGRPDLLFATEQEWRKRMLEEHETLRYWRCFTCSKSGVRFNQDAFIAHTRTKHAPDMRLYQLQMISSHSRVPDPIEVKSCPLCDWSGEEEGDVDQKALLDHIAKHIHSFSLQAFPWVDDNGRPPIERISHSTERVSDWLANSLSPLALDSNELVKYSNQLTNILGDFEALRSTI